MRFKQFISEEERKIYAKKYTPEEAKEVPSFSKSVAEEAYKISKGDKYVIIDCVNGLGSVPNNQDVMYLGFIATMKLTSFQELALDDEGSQDETSDWMIERIKEGYAIGQPWFKINMDVGENEVFQIIGHEGRGRVKAIKKYLGSDIEMPIQFILSNGMRNSDLTDDLMKRFLNGDVLPEKWFQHKGMTKDKNAKLFTIGANTFKDIIK